MVQAARSILAIDASPFGASLGLIAAIRAVRGAFADAFVCVAASTGICQLLTSTGLADETIDLGVIRTGDHRPPASLRRLVVLAGRSRRHHFDLVLDFSPRLETQIVSRLLVRGRTVTPVRSPRAVEFLLNLGGAGRTSPRSGFDDYASVLRQAGVEHLNRELGIVPTSADNERFERYLSENGSQGGELIALLYASDIESNNGWPVSGFGETGTRLANNFGARVLAADQPSDRGFTASSMTALPERSLKLASPEAPELVAAMARSSVVITDDEGVARLSEELGTPVIEVSLLPAGVLDKAAGHRVISAAKRSKVSPEDVYQAAVEVIHSSRSASLFDRA